MVVATFKHDVSFYTVRYKTRGGFIKAVKRMKDCLDNAVDLKTREVIIPESFKRYASK